MQKPDHKVAPDPSYSPPAQSPVYDNMRLQTALAESPWQARFCYLLVTSYGP